jgi:uncharacterized surface protein with fasciclin (FAS1) repeats/predicted heme/steroid binding protein
MIKKIFFLVLFVLLVAACAPLDEIGETTDIQIVIEAIQSLPNIDQLTIEDEVLIIEVRALYNALDETSKPLVTNADRLISAEARLAFLKGLGNLIEEAVDAGFSTLAVALTQEDLVLALSTGGPFTVFAPTNAAFDALIALLETDVAGLLAREDLKDILLYHVVDGKVLAAAVVSLINSGNGTASVPTLLNGASLTLSLDGSIVKINNTISISQTDIVASNGVIHVIDGVLLPPAPGSEPLKFNVRFNGFNNVLLTVTSYTEGTTLVFPTPPSVPGYSFEGWSQDGSNITQDTIIQANYEKIYFTLSELSQFNGKNGNAAYIGYNGVVYDVTNNPHWPNGTHRGYIQSGQDVTSLFASSGASHGDSNITNLPIVGFIQSS